MIAALSPADYNYDETLSTLRYAARAKAIKNKPKINEDPKDALLKQYEEEIQKLKKMLEQMNSGAALKSGNVVESLQKWETQTNIKMDLADSTNLDQKKEESIDDLIQKIQSRGAKVKILKDDEEATSPQTKIIKHQQSLDEDQIPEEADKENAKPGDPTPPRADASTGRIDASP